jgi:penicillin-binding protein 1A
MRGARASRSRYEDSSRRLRHVERKVRELILAVAHRCERHRQTPRALPHEISWRQLYEGGAAQSYFTSRCRRCRGEAHYLARSRSAPGILTVETDDGDRPRNYCCAHGRDGYHDEAASAAEPSAAAHRAAGVLSDFRAALPPRDYFTDDPPAAFANFGVEHSSRRLSTRCHQGPRASSRPPRAQRALERFDRRLAMAGPGRSFRSERRADETLARRCRRPYAPRDSRSTASSIRRV